MEVLAGRTVGSGFVAPARQHLPAVVGEQVGEQGIPEAERVTPATQALRQLSTVLQCLLAASQ